jgi:sRNA-binding carbon storage regulator CsrA
MFMNMCSWDWKYVSWPSVCTSYLLSLSRPPVAFPSVQINCHFVGHFPVRCSVRQGCPMSRLLSALILNPLLCLLERNLTGIRIGNRIQKTAVVAYADDVTIFVTAPQDINITRDLLLTYERVTGACLNIRKSKAMALGSWDSSLTLSLLTSYIYHVPHR